MKLTGKGQVTIPRMDLVDANVLLDVLTNDPDWCDRSKNKLLETVILSYAKIMQRTTRQKRKGCH